MHSSTKRRKAVPIQEPRGRSVSVSYGVGKVIQASSAGLHLPRLRKTKRVGFVEPGIIHSRWMEMSYEAATLRLYRANWLRGSASHDSAVAHYLPEAKSGTRTISGRSWASACRTSSSSSSPNSASRFVWGNRGSPVSVSPTIGPTKGRRPYMAGGSADTTLCHFWLRS